MGVDCREKSQIRCLGRLLQAFSSYWRNLQDRFSRASQKIDRRHAATRSKHYGPCSEVSSPNPETQIWLRADNISRRINQKTDRKDFLTKILEHRQKDNLSDVQIAAHSSDFVYDHSRLSRNTLSTNILYAESQGVRPPLRHSRASHTTFRGIPTSCGLCRQKSAPHSNRTSRSTTHQRQLWST